VHRVDRGAGGARVAPQLQGRAVRSYNLSPRHRPPPRPVRVTCWD
jgi:hypothetical protein